MGKKGFYIKIYSVVLLTILILGGLIYLILKDGYSTDNHSSVASATATTVATPSNTPTPVVTTPVTEPEASADPESDRKSIDITTDSSVTRIVNRNHTLSESYVPTDLVNVDVDQYGTQMMRNDAAEAIQKMFTAAENDGISLYLVSGYRSYEEQSSLYYTYEERYGREYADSIDDRPGESEHQLGLTADIGTSDHNCELDTCFADTSAFEWLQTHASEYGFIERYPSGKEDITGVSYSPWNYRYVGVDEAKKIAESGLTMEEYYETN